MPKKVEPSKPKENKYVKEVREYHEREKDAPVQQEEPAEIQNEEPVEQCQDNVPQEDIGEGLDEIPEEEPAAGSVLYENDEPILVKGENVLSVFQTQFLN